ncbi:MAG: PTS system fructose-specific EIIABC component [Candidatus Aerophobetes bacterium ADurb.Bin490]|jgi:fructose-specific phosphotransferase system IIA component|nr:MAG: PTS system fructose-specific EIIABC component [Candidatus Aerophobetes bacterium ADurb.Bin490]HPN65460.1 PTS sugar transporter subunit IIA [Candidatus Goldiibacteriota bacterium]HRQ43758.1 PTS sugar transporter subunit IIA [Candidatus Goldiibacteriota bacterium]
MRILDFLEKDSIELNLKAKNKKEAIEEIVEILKKKNAIIDKDITIESLLEREELGSTGVGQGIAIPHSKTKGVKELIGAFAISKNGVEFDALDGEPVNIFFLLLAPEGAAGVMLKALARVSNFLKNKYYRKKILEASDKEAVIQIIEEEEKTKQ